MCLSQQKSINQESLYTTFCCLVYKCWIYEVGLKAPVTQFLKSSLKKKDSNMSRSLFLLLLSFFNDSET